MVVTAPSGMTCRRCNGPIPAGKRSHAVYCSDLCGTLYRNARWQAANPEKMKAAVRNWRVQHPESDRASQARYRGRDKEAWAARFREWRRANRGKWNAIVALRYAAKRQATPVWLTTDDFRAIDATYDAAQAINHHVDHVVPLRGKYVCGLHVPWNLQLLPPLENIRKRNRCPV